VPPGLEPALRNAHQTAQMAAGQDAAMLSNILKLHGFCAAKNIEAFFDISFSSRSMRFSLRSRSFSRRSSASCAGALASSETARTHLPSVEFPTPKSDATWRRVRPLVSAMRTASRSNASLCIAAKSSLLDGVYCSQKA
jgi:hypothetical protein